MMKNGKSGHHLRLGGGNCWQSLQSNLLSAIFNDTNYDDQGDDDGDDVGHDFYVSISIFRICWLKALMIGGLRLNELR